MALANSEESETDTTFLGKTVSDIPFFGEGSIFARTDIHFSTRTLGVRPPVKSHRQELQSRYETQLKVISTLFPTL